MNRIVEYVFFFGLMTIVGYIVWQMFSPFVSALALSAVIVTICYPLYERILSKTPRHNENAAAFLTTIVVLVLVIFPLFFLSSFLIKEAVSVYSVVNSGQFGFLTKLESFENIIQNYVPGFELNMTEYLKQSTTWLAGNLGAIFAGTASTIFLLFISIIGSFFLFKDGRKLTRHLIRISPLPDAEDAMILNRLARAVRSVATGTILVALIQGTLTALGLWLFGFERAILWGLVAAFGALIPGIGTSIIFIPSVTYLLITGQYLSAGGLAIWGMLAVGLIDNLLGPYLMSRGNKLHPFIILLSVLGGLTLFGPIGFIVGPVVVSLFIVLLELYSIHISEGEEILDFTNNTEN